MKLGCVSDPTRKLKPGKARLMKALVTEPATEATPVAASVVVAGAVVVEKLFVIPGVGAYGLNAVTARDYPSVQGFILVVAAIFLIANLIVDLLYLWLDPRIRTSAGGASR
jgi:peptide/nickel transport system permease protein